MPPCHRAGARRCGRVDAKDRAYRTTRPKGREALAATGKDKGPGRKPGPSSRRLPYGPVTAGVGGQGVPLYVWRPGQGFTTLMIWR